MHDCFIFRKLWNQSITIALDNQPPQKTLVTCRCYIHQIFNCVFTITLKYFFALQYMTDMLCESFLARGEYNADWTTAPTPKSSMIITDNIWVIEVTRPLIWEPYCCNINRGRINPINKAITWYINERVVFKYSFFFITLHSNYSLRLECSLLNYIPVLRDSLWLCLL